ncbi:MAG: hypothetical protein IIW61_03705, partial [Bacteroidaceae bacterium]|nr:hypothetical protein [Bacteroidaceae bacterium]
TPCRFFRHALPRNCRALKKNHQGSAILFTSPQGWRKGASVNRQGTDMTAKRRPKALRASGLYHIGLFVVSCWFSALCLPLAAIG